LWERVEVRGGYTLKPYIIRPISKHSAETRAEKGIVTSQAHTIF
jgi:hypothetical protein